MTERFRFNSSPANLLLMEVVMRATLKSKKEIEQIFINEGYEKDSSGRWCHEKDIQDDTEILKYAGQTIDVCRSGHLEYSLASVKFMSISFFKLEWFTEDSIKRMWENERYKEQYKTFINNIGKTD